MADATQAVAEGTEAPATPTTEGTGAQDTNDLATFLSEFESATRPASPQPQTAQPATPAAGDTAKELAELKAWQQQQVQKEAVRQHQADIAEVIRDFKGDRKIPDAAVRGWIEEMAEQNPRLSEIWANRQNDPAAAKKMVASMKKDFEKSEIAKLQSANIDRDATDTRAAVAAAVRGASTHVPEGQPDNFASMSNGEARNAIREKYGYDPKF